MSTGNLKLDLLLNTILEDANQCSPEALQAICESFPSLCKAEAQRLYMLIGASSQKAKTNSSLIITSPPSFAIKAKATKNTVETLLYRAEHSILITGYSLSEYFDDLLDCIIDKSKQGILVRFFVNHFECQDNMGKICRHKGRFLKIYDYPKQDEDKMAALHAKVISVDSEKTLITSANLSYHGQVGNIELGTLVESKTFARELDEIFTKLLFKRIFVEI